MKFVKTIIAALGFSSAAEPQGTALGRYKVRDEALLYRMRTGFAGSVTRQHPVGIEPTLQSTANPPQGFGLPVAMDRGSQGVRALTAGDTTDVVYGITVRVYPYQQTTGGPLAALGSAVPLAGAIDVLKQGYILVHVNGLPLKGDPLYVWTAATQGAHIQGGFEAVATAGSTIQVGSSARNFYFNGPPGADGLTEIAYNV